MQSSAQSGLYTTQEEKQPPAGGHTIHQSYQQVYDDFESYAFVEDPTFKVSRYLCVVTRNVVHYRQNVWS